MGVKELRPAATFEVHLHSLQADLLVKDVRELPAEHVPCEQTHNRHHVEEAFLQRDVGDVVGSHLIHCRDLPEIHQAGESLGWITWNSITGFLVKRT